MKAVGIHTDSVRGLAVGRRSRVVLAFGFGIAAACVVFYTAVTDPYPVDFAQVWYAARAMLHGGNAYELIGPGRPFEWPWPYYYPPMATLVALPLATMPYSVAMGMFAGAGAAAFTWALTEHGYAPLMAWTSACLVYAVQKAQWELLLASAVVLPAIGVVLTAKPHIGLAIGAARPTRWGIVGAAVLICAAFLLRPHWVSEWLAALGSRNVAPHMAFHSRAPITIGTGLLVLLALARWRRPEARLLVALACVPQTTSMYGVVPLFLIPRGRRECAAFAVLSNLCFWWAARRAPFLEMSQSLAVRGSAMVLFAYLPATLMVLRRPNEGPLPAWLEKRIVAWPEWLRGIGQ